MLLLMMLTTQISLIWNKKAQNDKMTLKDTLSQKVTPAFLAPAVGLCLIFVVFTASQETRKEERRGREQENVPIYYNLYNYITK